MWHELPRGDKFWSFLISVDRDLAETVRQQGCSCGGRLHCANYPRRPRGCPDELPDAYRERLSFCCNRDGCRKRATPPSVRFLGPKVYLNAIVILITAMRHGATPRRVRELSELTGADRRTIDRWRVFWQDVFPRTRLWRTARSVGSAHRGGYFSPIADGRVFPCRRHGRCLGKSPEISLATHDQKGPIDRGFKMMPHAPAEDAQRSSCLSCLRLCHVLLLP